jgi:dephospho-CoA kinase
MLKVGITGGIGSGKTTVSTLFDALGIPVYYADNEAKRLMNNKKEIIEAIKDLLGPDSYLDGTLNRKYIADKVFTNPDIRIALNKIVHPFTIADAERWMMEQTTPYVLKEAALIFESGADKHLDFVIGVNCPEDIRIERIMKRDHLDKNAAIARIKGQMNEKEKMNKCHFIINNNEETFLTTQVLELHDILLQKAKAINIS